MKMIVNLPNKDQNTLMTLEPLKTQRVFIVQFSHKHSIFSIIKILKYNKNFSIVYFFPSFKR